MLRKTLSKTLSISGRRCRTKILAFLRAVGYNKIRESQRRGEEKMKPQTAVMQTETRDEQGVSTRYRLIVTFDAFLGTEVFSVFLTTRRGREETEDFVYDVARDEREALHFFSRIIEYRVTALHLREIAEDFLCEAATI